MRATILTNAIITKAHRVNVIMMAIGCIRAWALPRRCFLFLLLDYINLYAIILLSNLNISLLRLPMGRKYVYQSDMVI